VLFVSIVLPKFSFFAKDFNKVVSQIRAGGLILHYWHDPLFLEQTMDQESIL
jgi:hypothetical protein